ncbi:protein kinase domain-containing protein [Nonomuraea rubra]
MGTPAYMAPEQAAGRPITAAGDVFAWGGVVAYAGTGRPPFGTGQGPEVLYRVAHHEPRLDGLDERLRELVEQALRKDPARQPTAQQLLDRLLGRERATVASATRAVSDAWTPLLNGQASLLNGQAPPPPPAAPAKRQGGRWVAPAVAAVLASTLTMGGALALWRPWQAGAGTPTVLRTVQETVTTTAGSGPADTQPSSEAAEP